MRYLCSNQAGLRTQRRADIMADNQSKREIDQCVENNNTSDDGIGPMKKAKRFRSAFTTEQIKYLDSEFRKYPYIGSARRKEVSGALNIPERAVKIWFQNRRMKQKKDTTPNETDSDEHKHSRKIDVANDQLNNECTVTSTNNRHYASLPLISPKEEIPKNDDGAIKKANETFGVNDKPSQNNHDSPAAEVPNDLYKPYSDNFGKTELTQDNPLITNGTASDPVIMFSPKSEVTSTSLYDKFPQDLSRKITHPIKPTKTVDVQTPSGGYFPLNLKKYYAQTSVPVCSNMVWKPIQVLPLVSTGASTVSISNSPSSPLAVAAQASKKKCHCECRCHPPSPPAPVLLQQGSPNPLPQYVLTALPLQNPYYKY